MHRAVVAARDALVRLGNDRSAALLGAFLSPLRSIVAPFFGLATELLGGDPDRLRPLAESRKLAHVSAEEISHAAQVHRTEIVAAARSRLIHPDRRERLVPIGVCAVLVAAAALTSLPTVGTVSGGAGPTYGTRVVIGGLDGNSGASTSDVTGPTSSAAPSGLDYYAGDIAIPNTLTGPEVASNGAGLLTTYVVQAGDTLGHIAAQFGVSGTTLYWANKNSLPDPESIHVDQRLIVPPGDGLVIAVSPTDTIDSLAAKYEMTAQNIVDANHLSGPNIVTGQILYIPGASGGPIPTPTPTPTPKPTPKPQATSVRVASGGPIPTPKPTPKPQATSVRVASGGGTYAGGAFSWPVVGGRNYVSQYFSSYHHAIDIAATYGTPVVAAASGVVVRAGWDSYTQGGNVVWISDGTRLYTTYNHLSAWTVKAGQSVSAGERIGSIGTSGDATGPHLHFEVWLGYPWALGNNSDAVNPCIYLAGC